MTRKRRRLYFVAMGLIALGAATALVLTAFEENIVLFYSPTQVAEDPPAGDRLVRIGGLVADGSVKKDGQTVTFDVTDGAKYLSVVYTGLLPDLFREGQGVVVQGRLGPDGLFRGEEVLAKHDENYMPAEVADALKDSGYWQEGQDAPAEGEPAQ